MRIIIPNPKTVEEAKKIADRSAEDLFSKAAGTIVQVTEVQKNWSGDTMSFSFRAGIAMLTTQITGTVAVTSKDVTIDVVIPEILKQFLPEESFKQGIEGRVKGLLT